MRPEEQSEKAESCREKLWNEIQFEGLQRQKQTQEHTKQREIIALDRQGTQPQRPKSPTVTPPCVRVNTRYIKSTKGASAYVMTINCNIPTMRR